MTLDLGDMVERVATGPFAYGNVPSFAGISGGRTSAFMAALLDPAVTLKQQAGEACEKDESTACGCFTGDDDGDDDEAAVA